MDGIQRFKRHLLIPISTCFEEIEKFTLPLWTTQKLQIVQIAFFYDQDEQIWYCLLNASAGFLIKQNRC